MKPSEFRQIVREGGHTGPTAGICPGYAQANLVILPRELAYDFLLFAYSLYMLVRLLQMLPYDLPMTHTMVRGFLQREEEALVDEEETPVQEEVTPADEEELEQISVLDEIADTDPDAQ